MRHPGALPYKTDAGVRPSISTEEATSLLRQISQKKGSLGEKWDFTHKKGSFGDEISKHCVGLPCFLNLEDSF